MLKTKPLTMIWTFLAVLFFTSRSAPALGPHECVLLVNRQSRDSVELANYYAYLRRIPSINIMYLDLPDKALEAQAAFTEKEFTEHIYEPVQRTLRERGIAGHILAWVYSAGFPTTIKSKPPVSLTGMTFVRGNLPDEKSITSGQWPSPLFAGPDTADGPQGNSASMEEFTLRLTTNMPIPSMMLSWTGSRGLTIEEAKEHLKRSAAGDGAHPSATVFFQETADVRSQTRTWQFDRTAKELAGLGISAVIISNAPVSRPDVMGVMGGLRAFNKHTFGRVQPGAYADHLTSFAANFQHENQTKLTEWLKLGAGGTSGTVVEPGSTTEPVILWAKFPHARLFSHYANGCTLIESLYLSIRSPLQILLVGDPLCSPWAKPPGITLVNMAEEEDEPIKGTSEYLASSWGGFGQQPPTVIFFMDGRPVTSPDNSSLFKIDTQHIHDGSHSLRVVAYAYGNVRHQGFDEVVMQTRNRNRSASISGYEPNEKADVYHPLTFNVEAEGSPREAAIIAQERVLARALYTNNLTMQVPPFAVGAGPVTFQAVAVYDDNEPVRSEPLVVHLAQLNQPADIQSINVLTNRGDSLVLNITADDPEGDKLNLGWYADVLTSPEDLTFFPEKEALEHVEQGTVYLRADAGNAFATREILAPTEIKHLRTKLRFTEGQVLTKEHSAGVVFNYIDRDNYMFFGVDGQRSAWLLMRMENGSMRTILTRGAPIEVGSDYDILIVALPNGEMGFFVNAVPLAKADASFTAGQIGLVSGTSATAFEHLFVAPPSAFRSIYSEQTDDLILDARNSHRLDELFGVASDVQYTVFEKVR